MTLAHAYLDARNYRRAEEVLQSALMHDPQDAMLLTALALAQHLRRRQRRRGAKRTRARWRWRPRTPTRCGSTRRSSVRWGPQAGSLVVGAASGRRGSAGRFDPLRVRENPAQRRRRGGCPARGHRGAAPAAGRCRLPQPGGHGAQRVGPISGINSGIPGGAAAGARTRHGVAQHRCQPSPSARSSPVRWRGFARPRGWIRA